MVLASVQYFNMHLKIDWSCVWSGNSWHRWPQPGLNTKQCQWTQVWRCLLHIYALHILSDNQTSTQWLGRSEAQQRHSGFGSHRIEILKGKVKCCARNHWVFLQSHSKGGCAHWSWLRKHVETRHNLCGIKCAKRFCPCSLLQSLW